MLTYPKIDPIALSIGPLDVRWYGLMYLVGFLSAWWLARKRAARSDFNYSRDQVSDLIFYGALGVILGGRLGYIFFYDFASFINDPSMIARIWEGGMSFHGGLLGVILAMWVFGKQYRQPFFKVADFVAPIIPLGLGVGRIGNFINNELWGAPSSLPWAMVPYPGDVARHPSQLYQAALEGILLFIILWVYASKPRPMMAVSGLFLVGYGVFRFIVEFVRLPDQHIGYLAWGWVTMGQVLSLPMILFGLWLMVRAYRTNNKQVES